MKDNRNDSRRQYKTFMVKCISFVCITLIILGLFVAIIDPFYHYHKPIGKLKLFVENASYQNIGIAKHIEYDSFILGSSMTENFKTSQFEELYGGQVIKLSIPGGRVKNYQSILENAFSNDRRVKNIFYGLDIVVYMDDEGYEPNTIPSYLYDNNIFTDVEYILNKEVIFRYALKYVKDSFDNKEEVNWNQVYTWYDYYQFTEEAARETYQRPEKREQQSEDVFVNNIDLNLKKIEKFIKENPNTQFNIFLPPYSILYYDLCNQER